VLPAAVTAVVMAVAVANTHKSPMRMTAASWIFPLSVVRQLKAAAEEVVELAGW
jgi:hypothetical protein